jgi:hypothetical protein
MKTSETVTKVFGALIRSQQKMKNVTKDSKNPFFKSSFASINALREEAIPILNEEGLGVFQPPTTFEGKNYIETIIIHESGEFLSSLNEIIVVKQGDPQAYLAAQTYTRRGALQAFLSMGAEDDDGNYASGKADKLVETKTAVSKPSFVSKPTPKPEAVKTTEKVTTVPEAVALVEEPVSTTTPATAAADRIAAFKNRATSFKKQEGKVEGWK